MKKLSILACVLVVMLSCTKSKEVHPEIGDGNEEFLTVGITDARVEYTRADHSEISRVVFHYCPADANGNAQQFAASEMTKKETYFELALNNLLSDTLYWYYYELFPNGGEPSNTVQKTFHTEESITPVPPTPPTPPSGVPEGAINGLFTINEHGDQVYFSQGNLQYQASTNTWRFAENQWDFVGDENFGTVYENGVKCNNRTASSIYDGWIDYFCWGTSGYEHGADNVHPWATAGYFYAYGDPNKNLYDETGQADWGYNAISNGGNTINQWRTLTSNELYYLLETRQTNSGVRYVKALVNGINGYLIIPDDWDTTIYGFNIVNSWWDEYEVNTVTAVEFELLQANGSVFMPASGYRQSTSGTFQIFDASFYWTSSCTNEDHAHAFHTYTDPDGPGCGYWNLDSNGAFRSNGGSVRLAHDANP